MQLRSLPTLSVDVQVKTLCSMYSCILHAITAANYTSNAADCLIVLLLDVLSAIHDIARQKSEADLCIAWRSIMEQLMHAKSEVELCNNSCDLSAVTKKLGQMQDIPWILQYSVKMVNVHSSVWKDAKKFSKMYFLLFWGFLPSWLIGGHSKSSVVALMRCVGLMLSIQSVCVISVDRTFVYINSPCLYWKQFVRHLCCDDTESVKSDAHSSQVFVFTVGSVKEFGFLHYICKCKVNIQFLLICLQLQPLTNYNRLTNC